MDNFKTGTLNEAARQAISSRMKYESDLITLAFGVMDFMMKTGIDEIDDENLVVKISFEKAKVKKFIIKNDDSQKIDLLEFKGIFEKKLKENRKAGLARLLNDVVDEFPVAVTTKLMEYCRN